MTQQNYNVILLNLYLVDELSFIIFMSLLFLYTKPFSTLFYLNKNKVFVNQTCHSKKRRPLEIMPAESVIVVLKHTKVWFCLENTTSVKTLKIDKKSMI